MNSEDIDSVTCVVLGTKVTGKQDIELRLSVHIDEDRAPSFMTLVQQGSLKCKKTELGISEEVLPDGCSDCGHDITKNCGELQLKFKAVQERQICTKCSSSKQKPSRRSNRSVKTKSDADSSQELMNDQDKDHLDSYDQGHKETDDTATENVSTNNSELAEAVEVNKNKDPEAQTKVKERGKERIADEGSEDERSSSPPTVTTPKRSRRGQGESAAMTSPQLPITPEGAQSLRRSSRTTTSRFRRRDEGKDLTDTPAKGPRIKVEKSVKKEGKLTKKRGRKPKAQTKCPQKQSVGSSASKENNDIFLSDEDGVEDNMEDISFVDDEDVNPDFMLNGVEDKIVKHTIKAEDIETEERVQTHNKKDDTPKVKRTKCRLAAQTKKGPIVIGPNAQPYKEEYACAVCYRSFALKRNLLRHVVRAGTEKFTCEICKAPFHNQGEVDQHKLVHSGEHQYICKVCHMGFKTYRCVNKHVKIHLPPHDRPYICKQCGKGFTESTGLRYHMLVHAEDRPHECPHCDSKFAAAFLLQAHLKYHSNRKYRCYTCNREYKIFQSLKEHLVVHKTHYTKDQPDPVEKVSKTPDKRETRTRKYTYSERKPSKSDLNSSDAELMSLIDGPNINGTEANSENSDPVNDDASSVSETKTSRGTGLPTFLKKGLAGKFKCKICFRYYTNINHLNRHYRAYGKICYQCGVCNAKFHGKENRNQHKLVHDGINPYQCKVCFKSFKHVSTCKKHTLTHLPTNRRPFTCDICDKGFTCQLELDNHKWSHNKTDDNKCSECGELFRTFYLLQRHMNVHEGSLYKCKTCNKGYRYSSSLKDHLVATGHIGDDENSPRLAAKPVKDENSLDKLMCETCGLIFDSVNGMKIHKKVHEKTDDTEMDSEALRQFAYEKHQERIQASKETLKKKSHPNENVPCTQCGKHFKTTHSLRKHFVMKHRNGRLKCNLCDRRFYMPKELKNHMIRHKGERTVKCDRCPQSFFFEYELRKHKKIHLSYEDRRFTCEKCGKKFVEACYLREHMAVHTGEKPYKCEICDKAFSSRTQWRGHKKMHGGLVRCKFCPKTFRLTGSMLNHVRHKHSVNPPSHLCEQCGKSFNTKGGLKKHRLRHTSDPLFPCSIPECGKKFYSSTDLRLHQKSHSADRPYICETCGKNYKAASALKNHLNSHLETKPFTCEICLKSLSTAQRLREHMEMHLGEQNFQCEQCPSKFYTESALAYHKKSHLSTYLCQECSMVFRLRTRLKSHMKIHDGPERTQCPKCNVFYKDVNYLQTSHLKVCDPNKICPYCNRKFTKMRILQAHIGLHTGVRPFHCETCGHAFPKKELLDTHIEMHNWKRYPCEKCEKRFSRVFELKKHLRFHFKKETFQKRIQDYKERLGNSEEKPNMRELVLSPGTYISKSQGTRSLLNPALIKKEYNARLQKPRDILEEAAYSINIDSGTKFEVVETVSEQAVLEGETVVQYVQTDEGYTQVVQLEDGSLLHGSLIPEESGEQVVITTIDAAQLQEDGSNEIIMVAMVPTTE